MDSQLTIAGIGPSLDPALSQYHTPSWLAHKLVEVAFEDLEPDARVIEPSAGGVAIVRELLRHTGNVTAVEFDATWATILRRTFHGVHVVEADFLHVDPCVLGAFDGAVMNPPLNGGVGPTHVVSALSVARVVVSLLRTDDLHGLQHHGELWYWAPPSYLGFLVSRPEFGGPYTAQTNFVIAKWVRERGGPTLMEWI